MHTRLQKLSGRLSIKFLCLCLTAVLLGQGLALAQSTGGIRGTVTDQTGAVLAKVMVIVKHVATNVERTIQTGSEGNYSADNLQPGDYEVRVDAAGFQKQMTKVTVLTGNTANADFSLPVGSANEVLSVTADAPQINRTDYKIDGVITRERIQELPLNGRNFLELAQLEPGVTVRTVGNPGGLANSFTQVSIAGVSGALTRISVDGADVNDRVTGGSATNFSQESVQEFQISTFNYDLSTSVTAVGSVNIVSRGGTNTLHGSAFFFFRDHNMSAYPNLARSLTNPDPFFARRQGGFALGGPAKKDKFFWFTNFENNNQTGVSEVSLTRTFGDGGAFADTFNHLGQAPLRAKLFNARLDYKINDAHNSFLRYSEEHNTSLQPNAGNESVWTRGNNNAYQAVLGLSSVLTPRLVNDLRLNYNFLASSLVGNPPERCGASIGCIGAGGPNIVVSGVGFVSGPPSGVPTDRANRTYQLTDNISWQKGTHRLRAGFEFEKYVRFGATATAETGNIVLLGPDVVRAVPSLYNALPANLRVDATGKRVSTAPITLADILKLPVFTFDIGVGDASSPAPFNREEARRTSRYRPYVQDTWQIRPSFTLNYGLAWVYESNLRNYDLPRPELLRPLLGNLDVPHKEYHLFSPALGFAWSPGKDKKTVIRGGSGLYWDSDIGVSRIAERRILGPSGNGRVVVNGTGIANPFFGQPGQPATLSPQTVSALSGQQVISILPSIKASEEARFGRLGDLSIQNIELLKANSTQPIFSPDTRTPYSIQATAGIQREVMKNLVVTADFIMRRGVAFGGPHNIFSVDLNKFSAVRVTSVDAVTQVPTSVPARIIPACTTLAQRNDPNALCSVGAISVFQSASNTRYIGLHVKVDKRFSNRYQFTVSYAMSRYNTWNGIINLNDWQESYGINDGDRPHRLNISSIWFLPEYKGDNRFARGAFSGWQLSSISQFQSAPPLNPNITNLDADGEGTNFFGLPGIEWNGFGRGSDADDIRRAVNDYNANVIANAKAIPANATAAQRALCTLNVNGTLMCGPRTPRNQVFPLINLPANFSNGDTLISTDLRLTRVVKLHERVNLSLIAEGFNIFNIANLGGFSDDLRNTNFGQPTNRLNQVFGTGGPRAFQFAARLSF